MRLNVSKKSNKWAFTPKLHATCDVLSESRKHVTYFKTYTVCPKLVLHVLSRLIGESVREFYVKLIFGFQIKLSFSVFRKIGKTSEATLFNKVKESFETKTLLRHFFT